MAPRGSIEKREQTHLDQAIDQMAQAQDAEAFGHGLRKLAHALPDFREVKENTRDFLHTFHAIEEQFFNTSERVFLSVRK